MALRGVFLRRLLSRRWLAAIFVTFVVIFVAVTINAIGIRIVGDVDSWRRWLDGHQLHFFVWRLCVYGFTAYGWWWMRKRVRAREPGVDSMARLRRTEVAAICTIVLLEGSMLVQRS